MIIYLYIYARALHL